MAVLLIAASVVIVLGDWDGLSARMPTQVLPRRFARYTFAAGIALGLFGLTGLAMS